jgi:hypothetical protein
MTARLADAVDADGQPLRPLLPAERAFIRNETLLAKIDFAYWAERYCHIRSDKGLQRLYPLWEPQQIVIRKIAALQLERQRSGHPDGILINCLKARQEGISSLAQALIAHRVTTQTHINALIASDVPDNSGSEGLFGKFELIVEHLPWWLRPSTRFHTKNSGWSFDNGSWMTVESGKSMKGGLQDEGGVKGQLGRSKTFTVAHLSELSTWERLAQVDESLMPAIPRSPRVLVCKESTAKGRHNDHHKDWEACVRGRSRFTPIFLPWFALSRYALPPPPDWIPLDTTLAHGKKAEIEGPKWLGRPVTLTRNQLYWYEQTRAEYEEKGLLAKLLEEYASDPEEAFQFSGRSIFTLDQLQFLERLVRPPIDVLDINPARELTEIRLGELARIRETKQTATTLADAPDAPVAP